VSKLTEKRGQPADRRRRQLGALFGDDSLDSVLTSMRQAISSAGLDSLGVSVASTGSGTSPDALAGKLTFNQATFDTAWAAGPTAVKASSAPGRRRLRAVLRGRARPDHAVRRRAHGPARHDADGELTYIKDSLATMDLRLQARRTCCASSSPPWSRPSPRRSRRPPASPVSWRA
jgi:hypothetical protein